MVSGGDGASGDVMGNMTGTPERRLGRRFPIQSDLRYSVNGERAQQTGSGVTVNMSSRGVLFTTVAPVPPGAKVTLEIRWPVLLDATRPIKLVAFGTVVWCEGTRAAMHIETWEFRTQHPLRG